MTRFLGEYFEQICTIDQKAVNMSILFEFKISDYIIIYIY